MKHRWERKPRGNGKESPRTRRIDKTISWIQFSLCWWPCYP
uniref:Uncharacterized protein n=1 Tax=Arundo donax TaxID=35708 RepID=A0A0A8YW27_ARUDO